MTARLYTIGYQGAGFDDVVAALREAGVAVVADVRAVTLSRKRGFSKSALRDGLAEAGIAYRHFSGLGTPSVGRKAAHAGDAGTMQRIYAAQLATEEAKLALDELAALAAREPVCLLCFERDPAACHRRIIAERLRPRGFEAIDLFAAPV